MACCGGTRVEQLPFAMSGFRMTRRFFERVAALCTKLPVQTVATMAGLAWDTAARVDKRAIEMALGDRTLDGVRLRWIGVDEVSRVRIAKRLGPHIDSVIAGHQQNLRLGLVEAINGKIAALRVQARGYRDPEYYKLKIFQRCSLPDNPWAQIVL